MSLTYSSTCHLTCDFCGADGGTTTEAGEWPWSAARPKPAGWHPIGDFDICPSCADTVSYAEVQRKTAAQVEAALAEHDRHM